MSIDNRLINYAAAINEAFHQMMEKDETVFLIGQGVESPWYVGNTAKDLLKKFGPGRVIDTPVSENAITGSAVGAAIAGMRSVVVHPRMDFMLYAMDPIINEASNWHYMNGGRSCVPVVVWGCINRGGEQAAQHSQALHATFAHIPGLKVVMPSTPYDAKGLMVSAIQDNNPVIFIDDRWLHNIEEEVPEELYSIPIGKAIVRKNGKDVTLVASSYMAHIVMNAANQLEKERINVEVVDLRTIKPLDKKTILNSVYKTKKLIVADGGWESFGVSAEILAIVFEEGFSYLESPPKRICLPDCPAPSSSVLESEYYPGIEDIIKAVKSVLKMV